ncbi:MAG TPA: divalent-cation tolerance protein CutA [Bryobacteraceae bacterium]|nr:divalent-cation tolerance protein CutA [Bryobacteraceae bacterium]
MTDKIVVLSTCASEDEARRIAADLLNNHLAACVNLVPQVRSIYRWQGAIEDSPEILLIIKSSRPLFDRLRDAIARLHSYEVPEVIALPIVDGAASYLQWMDGELAREGD